MHKSCLFRAGKLRFSAVSRATQTIDEVEDSRLASGHPAVRSGTTDANPWGYSTLAERGHVQRRRVHTMISSGCPGICASCPRCMSCSDLGPTCSAIGPPVDSRLRCNVGNPKQVLRLSGRATQGEVESWRNAASASRRTDSGQRRIDMARLTAANTWWWTPATTSR